MNTAPEVNADGSRLTVHVPLTIRKRGGRKVVIAPTGEQGSLAPRPRRPDSSLVKAFARAHRWQTMLEEGTYASLRDLAAAEKISPTYISRLLRLTLLAPEIVEGVLDGKAADSTVQIYDNTATELWCDQVAGQFFLSGVAGGRERRSCARGRRSRPIPFDVISRLPSNKSLLFSC